MTRCRAGHLAIVLLVAGCVDTSPAEEDIDQEPDIEPIEIITTDPVPADVRNEEPDASTVWKNVEILGGGFVTGIVFSPKVANLIYARTDVGGAYRWNVTDQRWAPLNDDIGQFDANLMGIESLAADPVDPARVYLAAGMYVTAGNGMILRSEDYGKNWTRHPINAPMGGNMDGRSMGERLAIDPKSPDTLYFGSRTRGLWVSRDAASSWAQVANFPATGDTERSLGLSFVFFDVVSPHVIYVGVADVSGGPTLYRSVDDGATWEPVPGAPTERMPHHATMGSDGLLYITYNAGPGPNGVTLGSVQRLDTENGQWTNVSPHTEPSFGYGGVSVDQSRPTTLIVTTISRWPDEIFRSTDGGQSWREISGASRRDIAGAAWLYFGSDQLSTTGWMGDIEIDPFNRSRVLYITGQGIWWTDDVTLADGGQPTHWTFRNEGLEETVPLDLVSPPEGAPLLSALGDICGFRHDDLDQSPTAGMFKDPVFGNSDSIDFAEQNPSLVVRVGTQAQVRGAYSTDGGKEWQPFGSEPAESQGSGSIAVSADGATFLWSAHGASGTSRVAYSTDRGATWTLAEGIDGSVRVRVAADRVNPDILYAVSRNAIYRSVDGGVTFSATPREGLRDARLRPVFGLEGEVWLVSREGIERSSDAAETFTPLPHVENALGLGFGRGETEESYPALYLSGVESGTPGIFRSDDAGETFTRINDDRHQFGWVPHISGDPRRYGRVYLGTGGRGILYGDPR